MTHRDRKLTVSGIARVEGEGALRITVRDGQVDRAELNIYEPPRFFEAFLRGRSLHRAAGYDRPDLRNLPGGLPDQRLQRDRAGVRRRTRPQLAELRRLLYCGEWISSHALHIYLLHAPDFLGYPDAITLARDHRGHRGTRPGAEEDRQRPDRIRRRAGPSTRSTSGWGVLPGADPGRAAPARRAAPPGTGPGPGHGRLAATFELLDLELTMICSRPRSRPLPPRAGQPGHRPGLAFPARSSPTTSPRSTSPRSTALHATLDGHRYLTGPLARYSLNSACPAPDRPARPLPDAGLGAPAATRSAASWSGRRDRLCRRGSAADHRRLPAAGPSRRPGGAAAGHRARDQRGAQGPALPPL